MNSCFLFMQSSLTFDGWKNKIQDNAVFELLKIVVISHKSNYSRLKLLKQKLIDVSREKKRPQPCIPAKNLVR